jgi:hypothetical protein
MILQPSPINSSNFSFMNNTFSTFASDLGPDAKLGQVYDDACDLGFTIISEKTGKAAVFAEHGPAYDNEGDISHWRFVCVTPGLTYLKAVIFND